MLWRMATSIAYAIYRLIVRPQPPRISRDQAIQIANEELRRDTTEDAQRPLPSDIYVFENSKVWFIEYGMTRPRLIISIKKDSGEVVNLRRPGSGPHR
jgi:hypothetical protein